MLYRVLRFAFFPNSSLAAHVLGSYATRILLLACFILYGNDIVILFVVYGMTGFCSSVCLPGLPGWAELIKPVTGSIGCLFCVNYGIGDAAITFVMGAMIEQFGAKVIPRVLIVPLLTGSVLAILSMYFYRKVKRKEVDVLENMNFAATYGSSMSR